MNSMKMAHSCEYIASFNRGTYPSRISREASSKDIQREGLCRLPQAKNEALFPQLTDSREALLSLKRRHSLHSENLLSLNRNLEEDIEARKQRIAKLRHTLAQLENQVAQKRPGGKAYFSSGETPQVVRHAAKLHIVPFTPQHVYQLSPSRDRPEETLFSPLHQFPNPDTMQRLENSVKRVAHQGLQRRATYDHNTTPPSPKTISLPERFFLLMILKKHNLLGLLKASTILKSKLVLGGWKRVTKKNISLAHQNNQFDIDFENEIQDAFADDCADPVYESGDWFGDEGGQYEG